MNIKTAFEMRKKQRLLKLNELAEYYRLFPKSMNKSKEVIELMRNRKIFVNRDGTCGFRSVYLDANKINTTQDKANFARLDWFMTNGSCKTEIIMEKLK